MERHRIYGWGGRLYHVPKGFKFPMKIKIRNGWSLWVDGQPGFEEKCEDNEGNVLMKKAPIRPFRLMSRNMLPPNLRDQYSITWCRIFKLMEKAPGLSLSTQVHSTSSNELERTFNMGYNFLKTQVEYIFQRHAPMSWSLSTWSLRLSRSQIKKNGTTADIARLPEEKGINKRRQAVIVDGRARKKRHHE